MCESFNLIPFVVFEFYVHSQSVCQSVSQLVSQSVNQSVSQSVSHALRDIATVPPRIPENKVITRYIRTLRAARRDVVKLILWRPKGHNFIRKTWIVVWPREKIIYSLEIHTIFSQIVETLHFNILSSQFMNYCAVFRAAYLLFNCSTLDWAFAWEAWSASKSCYVAKGRSKSWRNAARMSLKNSSYTDVPPYS